MSNNKKINITIKDIVWNYLGSFLTLGMNVILLPVLLKALPSKDLGLWYVFSSISGIIILLDFGFSPTISRNVTCAWCGATSLNKNGLVSVITENVCVNFSLLKSLLFISKKIYRWISLISIIVLLTIGTGYIYTLVAQYSNMKYYLMVWGVYSISIVINMYFSYWNAFLKGIGALKESNFAVIIARSSFIIVAILGLVLGYGLLGIAIAQIISGIILCFFCKRSFLSITGKDFLTDKVDRCKNENEIFEQLKPNSTKYGIVSIGGFLSQRADNLLCSSFFGLEITSRYGLTMQLLNMLGSVSQLLFNTYSSQVTQEKINGNKKKVIVLFSKSIAFQFLVGVIGILSVAFIGPYFFSAIGTNTELLPKSLMLVIGFILLFEWNTAVFLNFFITSNEIPFVKNAVFSGFFIVACAYVCLIYTDIGLYSLLIGRFIIGFGFNNWFWPMEVCKELNVKFYKLAIIGFGELFGGKRMFIKRNR